VLSALRYLGPNHVTSKALAQVRSILREPEFEFLRAETSAMPSCLSGTFYRVEHPEPAAQAEAAPA